MLKRFSDSNPWDLRWHLEVQKGEYTSWVDQQRSNTEKAQESDERYNHGTFDYGTGQVCLVVCFSGTVDKFGRRYYSVPWQNPSFDVQAIGIANLLSGKLNLKNLASASLMGTSEFLTKAEVYSAITSPSKSVYGGFVGGACYSSPGSISLGLTTPGIGVGDNPGSVPWR
jgi:hypothetical protein